VGSFEQDKCEACVHLVSCFYFTGHSLCLLQDNQLFRSESFVLHWFLLASGRSALALDQVCGINCFFVHRWSQMELKNNYGRYLTKLFMSLISVFQNCVIVLLKLCCIVKIMLNSERMLWTLYFKNYVWITKRHLYLQWLSLYCLFLICWKRVLCNKRMLAVVGFVRHGFVRHGFKYVEKFSSDKRILAVVGFLVCVLSMLKTCFK